MAHARVRIQFPLTPAEAPRILYLIASQVPLETSAKPDICDTGTRECL